MFKRILVPLDRSPIAEQAIGQAMAIAGTSAAEVDLVLVRRPSAFDENRDESSKDAARNDGCTYLEAVAAELRSGANGPVTHQVLRGAPAEMIIRRAKEMAADLIVMTSHRRKGLSRVLFGSVVEAVIRHATVPVLILRPSGVQTARIVPQRRFRHILVATDGSSPGSAAVDSAVNMGKATGASLTLLQVVRPVAPRLPIKPFAPDAYLVNMPDDDATNQLAATCSAELNEAARRLSEAEVLPVDAHVSVSDHVAKTIVDFATTHGVDAIAMSTHGHGMSRYSFTSVMGGVLRSSDTPVLVCPEAAAIHLVFESKEQEVKTASRVRR